jgi:predicted glutamine amidotransferase
MIHAVWARVVGDMCRFVAYQGHPVLLADLLYRPRHSLVAQSYRAERMSQPFNADGFGVGWYPEEIAPFPCLVRTATPAWASQTLASLSAGISASRVFAHVRAASPGLAVQENNSHPFQHGRFLFMHNGTVKGFRSIRRPLQQSLPDWAWESIQGTTDSEHAFALLLAELGEPEADRTTGELRDALVRVLGRLQALLAERSANPAMACNFAVTDGRSTVVSRFAQGMESGTLHYSTGRRYECVDEDGDMIEATTPSPRVVIVASEPLTRRAEDWREIPANHVLSIGPALELTISPVPPAPGR